MRSVRVAGSLAHCPDGARVHLWRKAASSFDHFVGAQHKLLRDGQTQRFGGREVDDEFEFGWLFDRYVARPGASQNLIHVVGRAPEQLRVARSVGHESARPDEIAGTEKSRQT